MGGQNNGKISGKPWKGLLGNLRFRTTGKPWGCPPMGLDDSGQRTWRSLSFQVSWQPCSLLPPSESQPRPAREIPSEARAKVLWVCVCVGGVHVWCVVYMWHVHGCRMLHVCARCCLRKQNPTGSSLSPSVPGPSPLGGGQDSLAHLLSILLPCRCELSQGSSAASPPGRSLKAGRRQWGRESSSLQFLWEPFPRWLGECALPGWDGP